MCTAYEIGKNGKRLPAPMNSQAAEILRVLGKTRIVRPTLSAPVIMPDGELRDMSWGFRRQFRGAKGKPIMRTIVNSREDKLESPTWRTAFRERRCLIPMIAFYEWVEDAGGKSAPLRFTRPDDEWLLIAGIWEEGESGHCFSMLTSEPSGFVRQVHDRMPALLTDQQLEPYLDGGLHEFGPSAVSLQYEGAANFLRPDQPPAADGQQDFLF